MTTDTRCVLVDRFAAQQVSERFGLTGLQPVRAHHQSS